MNGQWSGVSLERFRAIARAVAADWRLHRSSGADTNTWPIGSGYVLPIVAHFVWEKAVSKRCLLDYILAVEASSRRQLLRESCAGIREEGSAMQKEWLDATYDVGEITRESIEQSLEIVKSCFERQPAHPESCIKMCAALASFEDGENTGRSVELLALSLYSERVFKLPIKLGRYAPASGGQMKPDCVEVVLREIIDTLIFNPEKGALDAQMLPDCASFLIKDFYASFMEGKISDIPLKYDERGSKAKNKNSGSTFTLNETQSEQTSAGQRWFEVCSGLSSCEYLTSGPEGQKYELKPGLVNVARALGELLGAKTKICCLKDFEMFWNSTAGRGAAAEIVTEEKVMSFRAPMSDTEMVHREMARILVLSHIRERLIEIELEPAHNLASAKQISRDSGVWAGELFKRSLHFWRVALNNYDAYLPINDAYSAKIMIYSSLLGDHMTDECVYDALNQFGKDRSKFPSFQGVLHSLLTSRWGEDRSDSQITDSTGVIKVASVALVTDAAKAAESRKQSLLLGLKALSLCHDHRTMLQLLLWLLSEVPTDTSIEELAHALFVLSHQSGAENIMLELLRQRYGENHVLIAMLQTSFNVKDVVLVAKTYCLRDAIRIFRFIFYHRFLKNNNV